MAGPAGATSTPVISISGLSKTYASGFQALEAVDLEIRRGEIFALLGPNGAGKTTLIGIVCGLINATSGKVRVAGHDIVADYRAARARIGLVPQELTTDAFESVWATVSFSRGLFGKPRNPQYIEKLLKELSLWDKRDSKLITLSGGMKRRVLIAKALSHEPEILFLDEPTAGVDVELRQAMWALVRRLRASGVTIILTTHYIDEAEEMADRIGVISRGRLILVENKAELMRKLGKKQLTLQLPTPLAEVPQQLAHHRLELSDGGRTLLYTYDTAMDAALEPDQAARWEHDGADRGADPATLPVATRGVQTGITALLDDLNRAGIAFKDLQTRQSSLEDIFVSLVRNAP